MSTTLVSCIYCNESFDSARGQGDHIIPAAMGEFIGDVRFRGCCPRCNGRIGTAEEELLRCTPEGFLRRLALASIARPAAARLRKRGTGVARGSGGVPPPKFTTKIAGRTVVVDASTDSPGDGGHVDQVVFLDAEGGEHQVRLWPNMRVEQLRDRMARAGVDKPTQAFLTCDEALWEGHLALLQELWPNATLEELPGMEPGVRRNRGRIYFTFTEQYFRAIAKIAFHYYLAHSRRGLRGDEPGFAALRRFIMEGGDHTRFFRATETRLVTPFDLGFSSTRWCHVLAAAEVERVAEVRVQLFVGPGFLPPVHRLTLGSLGNAMVVPTAVCAHQFVYDPEGVPGRAGRVLEIAPSAFRPRSSVVS